MVETLRQLDLDLFFWINSHHSPFMDHLQWWMTQIWFWIPLLLVVLSIMFFHYRKKMWVVLICLVASVFLTDRSSVLVKNVVQRPRPTHAVDIRDQVHVHIYPNGNEYRGGRYSFPSSHATNSFGLVVIFVFFFKAITKHAWWIFPLWAIINCYTRVYLGVHYPSDILAGTLLGLICGFVVLALYRLADHFLKKKTV